MTDFDELVFDQLKATSPIYWCQKENLGETCLRALSSFWASAGERILGPWLSAFRAVHVYSRWYWQRQCGNKQWVGQLFQLTELERQSKHRISFAAHRCFPLVLCCPYPMYKPQYKTLLPNGHCPYSKQGQFPLFDSVLVFGSDFKEKFALILVYWCCCSAHTAQKKTLASTCLNDLQQDILTNI